MLCITDIFSLIKNCSKSALQKSIENYGKKKTLFVLVFSFDYGVKLNTDIYLGYPLIKTYVFLITPFGSLKHTHKNWEKSGETALRNTIPFEHVTQSPVTVPSHTSLWVGVTTDLRLLQCSFQTCSPITSESKANFSLPSETCVCVSVTSQAFPDVVGASLAQGGI